MDPYDRFLAEFGTEEWHPRVYCTLPGRDWDADATEAARSCVIVAVRAPGRWARVPVPEDMILDEPDETAWLVKVEAVHTWEALAQPPDSPVS